MARRPTLAFLAVLAAAGTSAVAVQAASAGSDHHARHSSSHVRRSWARGGTSPSATPIKHLVVIFQENVSFDHYFGTYPNAANPSGEPSFQAAPGTPSLNGLSGALLTNNPNTGADGKPANPQRLDRSQPLTCDQGHGYTAEQKAYDMGLMDKFVQFTNNENCSSPDVSAKNLVMDYYDGNTVTGLWNYAQHFAMSDNSYSTNFGPSTSGAINVTAGNTYGAICGPTSATVNDAPCTGTPGTSPTSPAGSPQPQGPGTVYSDADPYWDVCSATQDQKTGAQTIQMGGKNIGDLLNKGTISWGWFQGGFASPGYVSGKPSTDSLSAVCTGSHNNVGGASQLDYNPHHEPFQYYASTANPQHLPPTSVSMIGRQDQANHQYDLKDFWAAAANGNMPAVSYLKAADYQDGHAGYSDPLDEQKFITQTINHLQRLLSWKSTAVVIAYDDSDGWYDHQMGPITTQSQSPTIDALTGTGTCGTSVAQVPSGQQGRCGVGPRQPLLVVSPYSRANYVDNTFTDQSSVVKFIEDNWLSGQRIGNGSTDATAGTLTNMFDWNAQRNRRLFLDPSTGQPTSGGWGH
ncbi:MAG TPA: alkaline phosphatase family protein [Solirubrobacteraceae bacterium]|jgi:phospholipase C|nr:alkaline phosphatase family protein [Solirubrobacteraceae bacterium]